MSKQINGKELIVNGCLNKTLTLTELLGFDFEAKRTAVHYLQVGGEYRHHHPEIDADIFEPLKPLYDYKQLHAFTEVELNLALKDVYDRVQLHLKKMLALSEVYHYRLGRDIHEAAKKLKFRGEFELTKAQLKGFVSAIGNWNDFHTERVKQVIDKLHETAPRMNYGVNNPNTGYIKHKWSIQNGEYICLYYEYCYEAEIMEINKWFKSVQGLKETCKADSFRLQVDEIDKNGFSARLVMWWD